MQSYKLYTLLACIIGIFSSAIAQTSKSYGVMLQRDGNTTPIKLTWNSDNFTSAYIVYRKQPNTVQWGTPIATLAATDTTYTDNVVSGTWEYRVQRNLTNGKFGNGYILTNATTEPLHNKGRLLLCVDYNYVLPLQSEIAVLISDLVGDGYTVDTIHVNRGEVVPNVKQRIMNWYYHNKNQSIKPQTLYLLGRIPVPYSGAIAPDGHIPDHKGAWPADVYYGVDNDEKFTDAWNNIDSATGTRNDNIPGDGKFDADLIYPDSVLFEIGRVDLTKMTTFGKSDTLLVKQYLTKAHNFKNNVFVPNRKAIIDDNFGVMSGEAFAASGWRSFAAALGKQSVDTGDFITSVKSNSYLMSFGCGAGTYTSANGIGNSSNFKSDSINTVFSMMFGSYFGDWDSDNNFLRAPLCSEPMSLVSVWSGRPHWNLHHMALGYTIGSSTQITQNNVDGQLLNPKQQAGYVTNAFPTYIHIALMGDPSLRLFYQPKVEALTATSTNADTTQCKITWAKQPNATAYHVYRANSEFSLGNLIAITTDTFITTTNFLQGVNYFSVRAKYIEESASGKFEQLALASKVEFAGGVKAVGVQQIENNKIDVTVYPNPAKNAITLTGDFSQASINIYTIAGQLVHKTDAVKPMQSLAIELPSGVYFIEVITAAGTVYRKLVVE